MPQAKLKPTDQFRSWSNCALPHEHHAGSQSAGDKVLQTSNRIYRNFPTRRRRSRRSMVANSYMPRQIPFHWREYSWCGTFQLISKPCQYLLVQVLEPGRPPPALSLAYNGTLSGYRRQKWLSFVSFGTKPVATFSSVHNELNPAGNIVYIGVPRMERGEDMSSCALLPVQSAERIRLVTLCPST